MPPCDCLHIKNAPFRCFAGPYVVSRGDSHRIDRTLICQERGDAACAIVLSFLAFLSEVLEVNCNVGESPAIVPRARGTGLQALFELRSARTTRTRARVGGPVFGV